MPASSDNSATPNYDYYDDPLFLSTADQPNASLSLLPFDGHDFMGWKREVIMSLAAKNKVGFVDGTCPKPPSSDKRFNQWLRCDYMILRWISNSLEKSLRENLKYVRSSKELWSELLERFGQANALEIYQLTKELGNVAQDNLSLIEYYGKLKNLWETLDCLDPLPVCSCGKIDQCSCTLMKRMVERESNAKLIQFLMNLNNGYDNIRTQILSMDPLPTINKVLGLLQKIERQKQITDSVANLTDSNAYASFRQPDNKGNSQYSKNSGSIQIKHCDNCNRDGHTRESCFGLNKCPRCNKTGHNPDHCFLIRGFPGDKKGKGKINSGQIKKTANSADVLGFESPFDEDPVEPVGHSGSNAASTSTSTAIGLNADVLDGLITSVVDQVLKRISDQQPATLSSANFAGHFK